MTACYTTTRGTILTRPRSIEIRQIHRVQVYAFKQQLRQLFALVGSELACLAQQVSDLI